MFCRYEKFKCVDTKGTASLDSFIDSENVSDYTKTAIAWAASKGLIVDTDENMLNPTNGASRGEIASVLARYLAK